MDIQKIELLVNDFQSKSKGFFDFGKYSYYAVTHHSTSIEGSSLTESQVINLLDYGKPAANKPFEHHNMVVDHYNALLFVISEAEKKQQLTPGFIQKIASMVMKNTGSEVNTVMGTYNIANGDFRLGTVRAGTSTFPDYKKVPDLVSNFCSEINSRLVNVKTLKDQCDLSFSAHFQLVGIHPFGDGNGRVSRLLMNYIQAWFGLPLSMVFKQDRIRYINALENARAKDNEQPFLNFMYAQYAKFLKKEIAQMK